MRIRSIKPEFWTDEDLATLTEPALILAIGLLNYADDEGYFNANPQLIVGALFPIRDLSVTVHGCITELSGIGFIEVADGRDGKVYGRIRNFKKHQVINRPKPSKIKVLCSFTDASLSDHGAITDASLLEQGTGNRDQGMRERDAREESEDQERRPHGQFFRALVLTDKVPSLMYDHVVRVAHEYPEAHLEQEENWRQIVEEALGIAGTVGTALPWLRKAVSRLEGRNVQDVVKKETPRTTSPVWTGFGDGR